MLSEHMRYLGVLGILAQCSVYVPEDIRETIEVAFEQACDAPENRLKYRRIIDRLEIEVRVDAK